MTKDYKKVKNHSTVQLFNHSTARKVAFTLAEVLITLAIIGVVAALTIPALLSNTNEKGLNTADSVFQRRLGEALKIMNLQGTLQGQPDTETFVKELGRHMKITKICNGKTNGAPLTDCFVSEFTSGEETIEVSDLKKSKNLYNTKDYKTETIGVVFGNGVRALVAYNPNCTQDQYNNSNEGNSPVQLTTSGSGKQIMVNLTTDSLSILYNLQERKDNNVHSTTGNIRDINVILSPGPKCFATTNGECVSEVITSWEPLDTCDGTNKWDSNLTSSVDSTKCKTNYWAGAKKVCADLHMELPDFEDLISLVQNDSWTGKPTSASGYFWSATEETSNVKFMDFSGYKGSCPKNLGHLKVLCVEK